MERTRENGDNLRIEFRGRLRSNFNRIMEVAFTFHDKATHFDINPEHGLVLYWTDCKYKKSVTSLPYPMDVEQSKAFAWGWLENEWKEPNKTMEKQPDHDGDNEVGFHIHTGDAWGHIDNRWEAWLSIKPDWILLDK